MAQTYQIWCVNTSRNGILQAIRRSLSPKLQKKACLMHITFIQPRLTFGDMVNTSIRLSVTLSPPKSPGGILPNLLYHLEISWLGCAGQHHISVCPSVRMSICLSYYLLLNHWPEFKLATSLPLMVRLRESNIIIPCIHPS